MAVLRSRTGPGGIVEVRVGGFLRGHKMLKVGKLMSQCRGRRRAAFSTRERAEVEISVAPPETPAGTAIEKKVCIEEKTCAAIRRSAVKYSYNRKRGGALMEAATARDYPRCRVAPE